MRVSAKGCQEQTGHRKPLPPVALRTLCSALSFPLSLLHATNLCDIKWKWIAAVRWAPAPQAAAVSCTVLCVIPVKLGQTTGKSLDKNAKKVTVLREQDGKEYKNRETRNGRIDENVC